MVVEGALGRPADRETDSWTAMFLPDELRRETARRLGAQPEVVVAGRYGPSTGSPALGRLAFGLAGLGLALLALLSAAIGPRARRLSLVCIGVTLGMVALVLDLLALLSSFPELERNEALLVFWPTDLALPLLPRRWLAGYLQIRIGWLLLVALGHLGVLVQPLAPLLLVALPALALLWTERRFAKNLVV
jgi:hypothetical protein